MHGPRLSCPLTCLRAAAGRSAGSVPPENWSQMTTPNASPAARSLEFTGERFVPGLSGDIVYEHFHRYAFARSLVAGRRVLDVACGEGYGSHILAGAATSVVGLDIDVPTLAHASQTYAASSNLVFGCGSGTCIPLSDASLDAVVSFETIEHLDQADQVKLLAEISRVLTPTGVLILSAPNRPEYSESRDYVNPFHRHEHDRAELEGLLVSHFSALRWYFQRIWLGSTLWQEGGGTTVEYFTAEGREAMAATVLPAMYFVVVAARAEANIPSSPGVSLYTDKGESELRRFDRTVRDAIRLDGLLGVREAIIQQRDAQLQDINSHVARLEALVAKLEPLVADRERIIVERDGQLEVANRRIDELARTVDDRTQLALDREKLVAERDLQLQATNSHVSHLEALVAYRESLIVERDRALGARESLLASQRDTIAEMEREIAHQRSALASALLKLRESQDTLERELKKAESEIASRDRQIAYQQSLRGWLRYPLGRMKRALWADPQRGRGA